MYKFNKKLIYLYSMFVLNCLHQAINHMQNFSMWFLAVVSFKLDRILGIPT